MLKRSGTYCDAGNLFGLDFEDLTHEQLKKINIHKLVEFLHNDNNNDYDHNIAKIIAQCLK